MIFSHGGKFGDLIYSLPAIRYLGGGELVLHPNPDTGMTFIPKNVETIRPLLEAQDYVTRVRYAPAPMGLNLDTMRRHWSNHLNITDMVFDWLGLPLVPRNEPWLKVEPVRVARVVFARCPRYHNDEFPWRKVVRKYGKEAVFVGLDDEYRDFKSRFGDVSRHVTRDLMQLAKVIAGAELFVGNQSSPRALAEGLKIPVLQETARNDDNCHWERPNTWYGYRSDVFLPDLPGIRLTPGSGFALQTVGEAG